MRKVSGAKKIYLVTPDFMLVYPEGKDVRLYYWETAWDLIGRALTLAGLLIVILHVIRFRAIPRRLYPSSIKSQLLALLG